MGRQEALQTGQAQMQMGLQALLLGRTLAVQLEAADSFFNPALSGFSAPTCAPVLLVAWIACSSADFEAACLPAQPLHACRLRTCFLSSQMCFQSLPKAVGRQGGSLQGAGFCFRPGCHGRVYQQHLLMGSSLGLECIICCRPALCDLSCLVLGFLHVGESKSRMQPGAPTAGSFQLLSFQA